MKMKIESEFTQLCLTLHDAMDCSLPGSSIHGSFQAKVLEWGAIAFSEYCEKKCVNSIFITQWFVVKIEVDSSSKSTKRL